MSGDADWIVKQQGELATKRSNFDSWWQEIGYRVLPSYALFNQDSIEPGQKRMERMFDSTAADNNDRFASVMDDLLTPRTQMWSDLEPEEEEIAEDQESKEFLQRLNKAVFSVRYRPRANFASQKHQGYLSVGAFGNSCMFVDEELGHGPRYKHLHLRETFWAENHQGAIDTLYRRFQLTGRQAVMQFGDQLPSRIATDAVKNPFTLHWFVHCVRPNDDRKVGRLDHAGMPFSSYYVAEESRAMVGVGGFNTWPFGIGRYMLTPGEVYARSPAMSCWPAILTLNEEKKTILRAGQREVDPPILLTEDGALTPFSLRPGALNHGAVSDQGQPLAMPFKTGANIPLGLELMQLEHQSIENAFLTSVFKVLSENPQMTATQVLELAQQKAVLLAPIMGRQQSEDLGPMIEREIDILSRMNQFAWIQEEMPDALRERGGGYKIVYKSPLARAMRAQDGVAIMRTMESVAQAVTLDKNAAVIIDVPAAVRELAEINGVPSKLVRDSKAFQAIVGAQQQAEQAASVAAMAPDASQAALNVAKADQLRRTA